ncbi:splicing factor 3B subunit 2 [Tubulinosema ratisbonensis]|uniref:Splicing factor 3B subunit 2 n=1 Tax=Tubulinosema ratisbonensis TaxID=291195 RepID=A0A437AHC9_9MICR|nr:splicing factor 3B subunit 2 [Tubulinosema ratisbonensis]
MAEKKKSIPKKINKLKERQLKYEKMKLEIEYPEHFSIEDIDSSNVNLLNKLKSLENTIPVPFFWKYKKINPIYKLNKPFLVPEYLKNNLFNLSLDDLLKNVPFRKLFSFGDLTKHFFSYEIQFKNVKPGYLSQELIDALGVKPGMKCPWFDNLNYFGLPIRFKDKKIEDFFVKEELNK